MGDDVKSWAQFQDTDWRTPEAHEEEETASELQGGKVLSCMLQHHGENLNGQKRWLCAAGQKLSFSLQ